ncbi:MAG: hypothetical protein KGM99_13695, partial [Burkholderiales bacterium]|nr:hypothetical protein [Burkholderiales bacterium]
MGQQLRAQLDVSGSDAPEIDQVCFRSRVESPDGNLLAPGQVNLSYGAGQRVLIVTTNKNLQEPAVKIVVDVGCEIQLHREYLALLDPPQFRSLTQNPAT